MSNLYDWKFTLRYLVIIFGWWQTRTTDTQRRHKSKISEKLDWCSRQNMIWPYQKIWDWGWISGCAVKARGCLRSKHNGLNIKLGIVQKSYKWQDLVFCQNDSPIMGSFWQKITHILFELYLFLYLAHSTYLWDTLHFPRF